VAATTEALRVLLTQHADLSQARDQHQGLAQQNLELRDQVIGEGKQQGISCALTLLRCIKSFNTLIYHSQLIVLLCLY